MYHFRRKKKEKMKGLRPSNTGNSFVQLVAQQCCRCKLRLLRVLPPSRATDFDVAESRRCFYFLQHENLLREVVIRATNNLNLQRNIVARQVARKCCPYFLALRVCTYGSGLLIQTLLRYHPPLSGDPF